ncbi:hypothetical protein, partial [Plasmodium yoelii yoelii]
MWLHRIICNAMFLYLMKILFSKTYNLCY